MLFSAISATSVVAAAEAWEPAISSPVLIVVGIVIVLGIGGWVLAKLTNRGE